MLPGWKVNTINGRRVKAWRPHLWIARSKDLCCNSEMKKKLVVFLVYIGDEILPSYVGIIFVLAILNMISWSKFGDLASSICLTSCFFQSKSQPPDASWPGPEGGWSSRNHPSVPWSQDFKDLRTGCEKLARILHNIREKKQGNTFGMLWDSIESLETHLSNEKRKKS